MKTITKTRRRHTPAETSKAATTQRSQREPTQGQKLFCNLAADLIMNGGQPETVKSLLAAVVAHGDAIRTRISRRNWPQATVPPPLGSPEWQMIEDMYKELSPLWPNKSDLSEDRMLPTTVTDQVKANLRDNLRESFDTFVGFARMHELQLLESILRSFESRSRGPFSDNPESVLAEAFMYEIKSDSTYLKVDKIRVNLITGILKTLDEENWYPVES